MHGFGLTTLTCAYNKPGIKPPNGNPLYLLSHSCPMKQRVLLKNVFMFLKVKYPKKKSIAVAPVPKIWYKTPAEQGFSGPTS